MRRVDWSFVLGLSLLAICSQFAAGQDSPPHTPASPASDENPFAELAQLESKADLSSTASLWSLVHAAYDRTLYGSARKYARRVLSIDPDHAKARTFLGHTRHRAGNESIWLNAYELQMAKNGRVRHARYGWIAAGDVNSADRDLVRDTSGILVPVAESDQRHRDWEHRRTVSGQCFDVAGCVPIEVLWFVSNELDLLVGSYCDLFELPFAPKSRFRAHLYRTKEDALAAKTDGALLEKYGAYFTEGTLHVMFRSLGGMTAVRHEAAHALNRVYVKRLPQWLDEGIGVYCQFAHVNADGELEFGLFPDHLFGTRFVREMQQGREVDLVTAAGSARVLPTPHDYSKFRALVDFQMRADNGLHRHRFINAVFRGGGRVEDLLQGEDRNREWLAYVKQQSPSRDWKYLRADPDIERIKRSLENSQPATKPLPITPSREAGASGAVRYEAGAS